jgi:hypothetical protein
MRSGRILVGLAVAGALSCGDDDSGGEGDDAGADDAPGDSRIIVATSEMPCIEAALAGSPPYDCVGEEIDSVGSVRMIDHCLEGAPVCWSIEVSKELCSAASHLYLRIETGIIGPPPGSTFRARCRVP